MMDLEDFDEKESFYLTWSIQNYNFYFRKEDGNFYESPKFVLKEDSMEKWCFKLYPKRYFCHDDIALVLQRLTNGRPREVMVDISISNVRGSFEKVISKRCTFGLRPTTSTYMKINPSKGKFDTYLYNDTLTINCRIWPIPHVMDSDYITSRRCYTRTVIGVERITYTCTLEGFEDFESGKSGRIAKRLIVLSEIPIFTMDINSTKEAYAENKIQIEITQVEPIKKYSTCEISLMDAGGNVAHSVRDEVMFELPVQVWTIPFIQVSKILSNKKLYLPNGILYLRCEFAVSSGVIYSEVERTEYGITHNNKLQDCKQTTDSDLTGSLIENLQRFYAEGKFSDLTIRTPNKEFRVHKTILCARSEVFSAMFERDMKESNTGVVDIEDVDDDTVSKMLLFVYTDTFAEDLEFGSASSLYFAADKYGILSLKRKCSDFMKGNFTVSNVCDVLALADMHQDQELKSAAQSFIFEHSEKTMDSEEWKRFMEENVHLASETMHKMCKRFQMS